MDLYSLFKKYPRICTDTRAIVPDSLFFALRGENFNANAFAAQALENGCAYAIVDDAQYAVNERFILTENVLKTLQDLANEHRKKWGKSVIGITGTNGKTTTKELIACVLSEKYNVLYTQGNLNNHIGVPLTLLQLTDNHDFAVVEMGANHLHEIAELCAIAEPTFGLITNVGRAHLEGFGSFEGIMQTKSELYEWIANKGTGIFINSDNEFLAQMAENRKIDAKKRINYSLKHTKSYYFGKIADSSLLLKMNIKIGEQNIDIQTNLTGTYNGENVLAAACVGNYFDVEIEKIQFALQNYKPTNNRSQFVQTQRNCLIIDAYNANPTSMREAILSFENMKINKKIVILGDMYELGTESQQEHQKIVHLLEECNFDNCFLIGKNFAQTRTFFQTFANTDEFVNYLKNNELRGFNILIKGSRAVKLEKTIELL
ncbi:MAG: UDP-N-acetylmuramoyl-tripeptide--D-alanyl-D-alanine ligase [Paludibacter sp.]|nr:UDP-N-acetylmuramoyl-tripeptide--D-alanyl-D-alanine ligase [Paludibacter sp.]